MNFFHKIDRSFLFHRLISILRKIKSFIFGNFHSFNLTKLAIFYGTDKWGRHSYTTHYQFFFRKFKFTKIKLLEIGVGGDDNPTRGGRSLRMWKKYFPLGQIYSIDIYDKKKIEEPRIHIFQGSQTDEDFLNDLIKNIGSPTIIVDDGSHISEHVIKSFEILFPHLKPGGIYAIEDTGTSYLEDYGGDNKNINNSKTSMNYFKSFPDRINREEFNIKDFLILPFEKEIQAIHFFHELIIIEKTFIP